MKRSRKKRSWIARMLLNISIVLLLLFVALSVYLYTERDHFEEYLTEYVNQSQNGTLELGDIQFSPFTNFPKVSIRIKDLAYYMNIDKEETQPFVSIGDAILSFDIYELVKGRFIVNEVIVNDGELNYQVTPDTLNLETPDLKSTGEVEMPEFSFDIDLRKFVVNNLKINYSDSLHEIGSTSKIERLVISFKSDESRDHLKLQTSLILEKIELGRKS